MDDSPTLEKIKREIQALFDENESLKAKVRDLELGSRALGKATEALFYHGIPPKTPPKLKINRDEPLGFESPFSEEETPILLEAAHMGLFRCLPSLSDKLDIDTEELSRLRDKLQEFLNRAPNSKT